MNYLRVWGCRAIVRVPDNKRKKLGERGFNCIFVGYAHHSHAYRFYVIESNDYISANSITKSRDVIFDETRFSSIGRPKDLQVSTNVQEIDEDQLESQNVLSKDEHIEISLRRIKRRRIATSFGPDFEVYLVEGTRDYP